MDGGWGFVEATGRIFLDQKKVLLVVTGGKCLCSTSDAHSWSLTPQSWMDACPPSLTILVASWWCSTQSKRPLQVGDLDTILTTRARACSSCTPSPRGAETTCAQGRKSVCCGSTEAPWSCHILQYLRWVMANAQRLWGGCEERRFEIPPASAPSFLADLMTKDC